MDRGSKKQQKFGFHSPKIKLTFFPKKPEKKHTVSQQHAFPVNNHKERLRTTWYIPKKNHVYKKEDSYNRSKAGAVLQGLKLIGDRYGWQSDPIFVLRCVVQVSAGCWGCINTWNVGFQVQIGLRGFIGCHLVLVPHDIVACDFVEIDELLFLQFFQLPRLCAQARWDANDGHAHRLTFL